MPTVACALALAVWVFITYHLYMGSLILEPKGNVEIALVLAFVFTYLLIQLVLLIVEEATKIFRIALKISRG